MMSKYSGEKRRVSKKEKGPACCYRNRGRGEEGEVESVNVEERSPLFMLQEFWV